MADPSGLAANTVQYGDPEFALFLRKAFIKGAGYSDADLSRPIVGIINTGSDFNPCHGNMPALVEAVKRGVMLSGALPMVFPTISLHESFASPTSLFFRNLMSMDTEEMIRAQPMDAVVLIGGCDKTLPAQIMGAISAKRPYLVLPTGPMLSSTWAGERVGACTDCRRLWADFRAGRLNTIQITQANARLVPSVGTCSVMGTASTMACVVEAMGLAVPGAASAPAVSADRVRVAEATGEAAARLAQQRQPAMALTEQHYEHALRVLLAIGGSTNALVHLAAIMGRQGLRLDPNRFNVLAASTPVLVDLKPGGVGYMPDFHEAGGVPRLLRSLAPLLDLHQPTAWGGVLADGVEREENAAPQTVIRAFDDPIYPHTGLKWLTGNLAPHGAVIKPVAASQTLLQHTGRAVVFDGLEDLSRRIDDPALDVQPSDVLVLRGIGPRAAGMPEAGLIPIPKQLASKGVKDMVRISDGRMSGTAFGTIVLHISPEAAAGGPLACVRSGDLICLDVAKGRLDLLISEEEMQTRRAHPPVIPVLSAERGYAWLHAEQVTQAEEGCDFRFLRGPLGAATQALPPDGDPREGRPLP
ncbi:IlvD Dihydroxyacid dehydratase/phosphogluconate dehydratase [Burkholderiales bacterium]